MISKERVLDNAGRAIDILIPVGGSVFVGVLLGGAVGEPSVGGFVGSILGEQLHKTADLDFKMREPSFVRRGNQRLEEDILIMRRKIAQRGDLS